MMSKRYYAPILAKHLAEGRRDDRPSCSQQAQHRAAMTPPWRVKDPIHGSWAGEWQGRAGEIAVAVIASNRRPVALFRPQLWVGGGSP